jgi:hypothetical protein
MNTSQKTTNYLKNPPEEMVKVEERGEEERVIQGQEVFYLCIRKKSTRMG